MLFQLLRLVLNLKTASFMNEIFLIDLINIIVVLLFKKFDNDYLTLKPH